MKAQTFARIQDAIANALGISPFRVGMNSNFKTDLGADSLAMVAVAHALEEEFDVPLADGAPAIKTVAEAALHIERALKLQAEKEAAKP